MMTTRFPFNGYSSLTSHTAHSGLSQRTGLPVRYRGEVEPTCQDSTGPVWVYRHLGYQER